MKFRPCIDLHSGQVKQIVGSTLLDKKEETPASLATNFETDRPAGKFIFCVCFFFLIKKTFLVK